MEAGWNAIRSKQEPLGQPCYDFRDVPRCARDLSGSSLQRVTERDQLKKCMGEIVLLCNEAVRRQRGQLSTKSSKPLNLEYIADRLDIDEPLWGFCVRTDAKPNDASENWVKGMLQGFITVTTFTNWQPTFRWDSKNEAAFSFDGEKLAKQMHAGERKFDSDGSLANALQATVRRGDIWGEGIVWPRIAEISLLGGLGCGKVLLSLAIEHLENMKPSGQHNYDYVVLQATDNSVPFYESMGFVRVGAITEDQDTKAQQSLDVLTGSGSSPTGPVDTSAGRTLSWDQQQNIFSVPLTSYTTKKAGETPSQIAKKLHVNVWDVVFLNRDVYEGISSGSWLMKNTTLRIPLMEKINADDSSLPEWHIARENETPKIISKKFSCSCRELVEANRRRLPELLASSRLKEGTRIKVSHFHVPDENHVPYCHWSFPDDAFEPGAPSYMMVRKLQRRKRGVPNPSSILSSLAVELSDFAPSTLLLNPKPLTQQCTEPKPTDLKPVDPEPTEKKERPPEPKQPKRPPSAYKLFADGQREGLKDVLATKPKEAVTKFISDSWRQLADSEKSRYIKVAERAKAEYDRAKTAYDADLEAFRAAHPDHNPGHKSAEDVADQRQSLFNKVVKIKSDAPVGEIFDYWYVLTFIPDLQWCRLAPLHSLSVFGPERKSAAGRPKWKLVDESIGGEIDISSQFCVPVKSRMMKKTEDADLEEWDIIDGPNVPQSENMFFNGENSSEEVQSNCTSGITKKAPLQKQPKFPRKTGRSSSGYELPTLKRKASEFESEPPFLWGSTACRREPKKAANHLLDEKSSRKARKVNSAGSLCAVLQD